MKWKKRWAYLYRIFKHSISFDDDVRRLGLQNITQSLTNETLDYELNVANALWVNDSFKVHPEYADIVNIHYDSIIDSFNSSSSDKINKWANDSTRGKISKIVDDGYYLIHNFGIIITNAIYFNASGCMNLSIMFKK